jgi:TonB family protein
MSENPEKSGSTQSDKDRRLDLRQRIHSLSYVEIGDGNGGIVLNISEEGISVQAAAVLDPNEPVPMRIQIPRVRKKLEVTGEIVWLSASRKEAGIRFIDLPESALRQIQQWMAREASPEKFEDENDPVHEEEMEPAKVIQEDEARIEEEIEAREEKSADDREDEDQRAEIADSEPDSVEEFEAEENEEMEGKHESETKDETEAVEALQASREESAEVETVEATAEVEEEIAEEADATAAAQVEAEVEEEVAPPAKVEKAFGRKEPEKEKTTEKVIEDEPETEDELIEAFGPPVVPFERRPHAPFSAMNAMSGTSRSSQNLAIAPTFPMEARKPFAESAPAPALEAPASSDWKDFRVQLQTGWFLAALVLLLAMISFIAGMAVRRGALNGVLGETEDTLVPKSAPTPGVTGPSPNAANGAAAGNGTPAKPLSIEIVDMANRRWVIPASSGNNRPGGSGTRDTTDTSSMAAGANTVPTPTGNAGANRSAAPDASARVPNSSPPTAVAPNAAAANAANGGKPSVPLVLSLPETPISASGSVAISSQRSVPVPQDGSASAKNGRNLQVGQLINLVEPTYPAEAVQQKIEGTVKLHAVIGTDGVIESLAQVSGPQILVNASMAAVRNWKYSPTRMNGQAIETHEDISFVFRLPN